MSESTEAALLASDDAPESASVAPIAAMARDFSRWLNSTYPPDIDPEAHMRRRVLKVGEEAGEVSEALGMFWGENPRKDRAPIEDVIKELADCVGAALGAIEHLTGHEGRSLDIATERVRFVCARVGVRERACCDHADASHDSDGSCFEDVSTTRGYAAFCHGPEVGEQRG